MIKIAKEATMKNTKYVAGSIAALLLIAALGLGQDQASHQEAANAITPVQVTIIFNEYDGSKRVSSLPYQMVCNARPQARPTDKSSLRLGLRVPIATGSVRESGTENVQWQYQDVGTNIDCLATAAPEGGFIIELGLQRHVVYPPSSSKPAEWQPGSPLPDHPIEGGFEVNVKNLLMRDGETVQAATATDPVSGHVWKIDVSLKVGK